MDAERRQHYLADFKPKRAQDRVRSKDAHLLSTSREQHARQAATWRELYLDMSRTRERTTLLEQTMATLDARAIVANTDVELLRVPTDPTFIHIKGRLGKRLTAAMQQTTPAAAQPDPHQLDDSFFVQLKSPTPPPPPTPPPDPEEADRDSDADAAAPSLSSATVAEEHSGNDGESRDDVVAGGEEETVAGVAGSSAVSGGDDEESAAVAATASAADSETVAVAACTGREDDEPEEGGDDDSEASDSGNESQQVENTPGLTTAADGAVESGDGGATRPRRTDSARSRRTESAASPPPADDDEGHTSGLPSPAGGARDAIQSVDAEATVDAAAAAPAERRRVRQKHAAAFLPRLRRFEPPAAAASSEPSTSPPLPPVAGAVQRSHVSAPVPADKRHKGHRGGGGRHVSLPELLPAPKPWRPMLRCPLCMCRTTDVAHVYEAAKWLRHRIRTPARRSLSLYGLFARS